MRQVHSEGYKIWSKENARTKAKWDTNKEQKLKQELVEAKPDGTIFSLPTKLQQLLYTTTKSREVPIKYHKHRLQYTTVQYQNPDQYNAKTLPYSNMNSF